MSQVQFLSKTVYHSRLRRKLKLRENVPRVTKKTNEHWKRNERSEKQGRQINEASWSLRSQRIVSASETLNSLFCSID